MSHSAPPNQVLESPPAEGLAHTLHELRTPLNQIIGFSEMIIEIAGQEERPDLAHELSVVRECGLQINQHLSDNTRLLLAVAPPPGTQPIFDAVQQPLAQIQNFLDRALAGADEMRIGEYRADLNKIRLATIHFATLVHTCQVFIQLEAPNKPAQVMDASTIATFSQSPISGRILIVDDEVLSREILCRRLLREA